MGRTNTVVKLKSATIDSRFNLYKRSKLFYFLWDCTQFSSHCLPFLCLTRCCLGGNMGLKCMKRPQNNCYYATLQLLPACRLVRNRVLVHRSRFSCINSFLILDTVLFALLFVTFLNTGSFQNTIC